MIAVCSDYSVVDVAVACEVKFFRVDMEMNPSLFNVLLV